MTFPTITRRMFVALALLLLGTPIVRAGSGMSYEDCPHARATATAAATNPHNATRATNDDDPALPGASSPTAAARAGSLSPAAPHASSAPLPVTPDHRSDKRERGRTPASPTVNSHRPATQRSKSAVRNTPATPGMGMLLRMGASAGREISAIVDVRPQHDSGTRMGRAPPRGDPDTHLALALPPSGSPLAATPLQRQTLSGAPEAQTQPHLECAPTALADVRPRAGAFAHFRDDFPVGRPSRSCAVRLKGAAVCPPLPFGGLTA